MPDAIDAAALEKSLNERLRNIDWKKARPANQLQVPNVDEHVYNDLKRLSAVDFEKAAKAWSDHAPKGTASPAFLDREVKHQVDEARQTGDAPSTIPRGATGKAIQKQNAIEPVKDKARTMDNETLAIVRGSLHRKHDQMSLQQEQLGLLAEDKRISVENLAEKASEQNEANGMAERTGETADWQSHQFTEREKNRQIELMEHVHRQFRVVGSGFHFKDQPGKLAFRDMGKKMASASNEDRVAKAMATMAEAKGWKTIKVAGHYDFRREVWMDASMRGIEVRGYKPTEQELKLLHEKREYSMHNAVEENRVARTRKTGQHRTERQPDAASLRDQTDKQFGSRDAGTDRRSGNLPKSEKHKVAEAVASALIDSGVRSPMQRKALKAAINARLAERERAGRLPEVPIFDKAAPARKPLPERRGPVVERDSERTR
jgi:putative DNA primase/helicase